MSQLVCARCAYPVREAEPCPKCGSRRLIVAPKPEPKPVPDATGDDTPDVA